ncbi:hypothetical protein P4O66_009701, partial [Electrophorus voltai]
VSSISKDKGDQYQGLGSVESYYPYWDHQEYYGEHDRSECQTATSLRSEYSDVSFQLDSDVYQKENLAMEVEEALHRDSLSEVDTMSVDSESEEDPAPK